MTLILSNDDVESALSVRRCLDVMEESYREQAESRPLTARPATPICRTRSPTPLIVSNRLMAAWANTAF